MLRIPSCKRSGRGTHSGEDDERIAYLRDYMQKAEEVVKDGMPLMGGILDLVSASTLEIKCGTV